MTFIEKGKTSWKYILIVAILVVIIVGVFVWQQLRVPSEEEQPQVGETIDWETYRNEKYGFIIQYPVDYEIDTVDYQAGEKRDLKYEISKDYERNADVVFRSGLFSEARPLLIYLSISETQDSNIDTWFNNWLEELGELSSRYPGTETYPKEVSFEDVRIDNVKAKKVLDASSPYPSIRLFIIREGYIYKFYAFASRLGEIEDRKALIDQMLSTFRFLDR